jgi:hypothetical protein
MVIVPTAWIFLPASVLLGISRGTRAVVFAPAIRRLAGTDEATPYFAVAPLLLLPLSLGLPLAGGAFLDATAGLGAWSYRILFLVLAACSGVGLAFAARMKTRPRP